MFIQGKYNFFPSKEAYVYAVLQYRRKIIPELIKKALNGKEKAGPEELKILSFTNSVQGNKLPCVANLCYNEP